MSPVDFPGMPSRVSPLSPSALAEGSADPLSVLAELSHDFADSLDLDRTIEKALVLIARLVGLHIAGSRDRPDSG